jgi:BlaR1 peptidase M56
MPVFFLYLLKLSLSLAAVYLLYMLLLRRLTFYRWNRMYLLAYPLACFLIPLIDIAPLLQQEGQPAGIITYVPLVQELIQQEVEAGIAGGWKIMMALVASGMLLLLCRLLLQYFSLQKIRRQSVLLSNDGIRLYQVDRNIIPFSFANAIYINQHNHTQDELKEIIRHEYVHVKRRHSFDILLGELICIINWYNPFAWLLRRAIRQNLEFEADNCVLESGIDKKTYQYLLLKVVGTPHFRIVNQFNFSSLKKRIVMMNKIKTTKVHLVKFAFVLPLAAILLLAFRENIAAGFNTAAQSVPPVVITDTVPEIKQEGLPTETQWSMAAGAAAEKSFRKRHPKVARLAWAHVDDVKVSGDDATEKLAERFKPGPVLYVYFTNGKHEVYFLSNDDEIQRFKKNYGELPPAAPPPPPPAAPASPSFPAAPASPSAPAAPSPASFPAAPSVPAAAEYPAPAEAPQPPSAVASAVPPVPTVSASIPDPAAYPATPLPPPAMPANVKSIHINNQKVTITLINGTIEKYDLNNPTEKDTYLKKYGKLPEAPAPPPYPAVERYREAAKDYQKQLKLANIEQLSADLAQLKALNELKAAKLNQLKAAKLDKLRYLKAQSIQLEAQKRYLELAKGQKLAGALKRLQSQSIYLQKQKSLTDSYRLKLQGKKVADKPAAQKPDNSEQQEQ